MAALESRELEAFLTLAEELHFGRTAERLYVSQSRISQLLRSLESRIGARLVDRTSRRVALTPLGEQLLSTAGPAYDALLSAVNDASSAARCVGTLRVGFQGTANGRFLHALTSFQHDHPQAVADLTEIPLSDPFGAILRGDVDVAAVLLPVQEPELVVGHVFSRQPNALAVPAGHPFARRDCLDAEDLAAVTLISVHDGAAPAYWRRAQAPTTTPKGLPVASGPRVNTLHEALPLVQSGRGAFLLCRPTANFYAHQGLTFVPVKGLPDSALGLVWHRERATESIRSFARAMREHPVDQGPEQGPRD
ncbi:LysR family transcriptional regulator [Streptomyces sp. NPDC087440]|uniref:LysR family transcriptional regulator n=1 Tax=Streptomyces sp. NPDC087440 TaxID=3365790 RepID=UPI00381E2FE3